MPEIAWPVLAAIVSAIFGLIQFGVVFWFIVSHLQQVLNALDQAAQLPGIAIAGAIQPLTVGFLAAAAGLGLVAILYSHASQTKAPTFSPAFGAPVLQPAAAGARAAPYVLVSPQALGLTYRGGPQIQVPAGRRPAPASAPAGRRRRR